MLLEGWKQLVNKSWGDYVILHNLPFHFNQEKKQVKIVMKSFCEMQRSAKDWSFDDFSRQDLSSYKDFH